MVLPLGIIKIFARGDAVEPILGKEVGPFVDVQRVEHTGIIGVEFLYLKTQGTCFLGR